MSGVVLWTASLVPEPPYVVVPLLSTLGGLANSIREWRKPGDSDWPLAWVLGNVMGSAFGVIVLLALIISEVT